MEKNMVIQEMQGFFPKQIGTTLLFAELKRKKNEKKNKRDSGLYDTLVWATESS